MSEQRWTIHVCPECSLPYGEAVFCEGDGLSAWHEERETEPPIEVVPESELSLSLAREQRLRSLAREAIEDAHQWARLARDDPTPSFGILEWRMEQALAALDALSSVPDGERS